MIKRENFNILSFTVHTLTFLENRNKLLSVLNPKPPRPEERFINVVLFVFCIVRSYFQPLANKAVRLPFVRG